MLVIDNIAYNHTQISVCECVCIRPHQWERARRQQQIKAKVFPFQRNKGRKERKKTTTILSVRWHCMHLRTSMYCSYSVLFVITSSITIQMFLFKFPFSPHLYYTHTLKQFYPWNWCMCFDCHGLYYFPIANRQRERESTRQYQFHYASLSICVNNPNLLCNLL